MFITKDIFRKHNKDSLVSNDLEVLSNTEYIARGNWFKGKNTTFQECIRLFLIIGQCFGLNPVLGICKDDPSKLRFTFQSGKFIYSLISILGQSIFVFFIIAKIAKGSNTSQAVARASDIVFFGSNWLITVLFVRVSMKWPHLCKSISQSEASDPLLDSRLKRRCKTYCCGLLALALLEHVLAAMVGLLNAIDCVQEGELFEFYVSSCYPWIFDFVEFNYLFGVLTELINIQCTFNWSYVDLFVICISLYLTARFEQVNKRIIAAEGKYVPSNFWRTMREDYSRITLLVKKIDDVIGGLIFISFANNLFFVCVQLLHILSDGITTAPSCRIDGDERWLYGIIQPIYHGYSVLFLLGRSLAVSLLASAVHTASRRPAVGLYQVSSAVYCVETQRFMDQIHGETVALTGLQFFNVKKGLVLKVVGTIVTYELVLMQFSGITPTPPPT